VEALPLIELGRLAILGLSVEAGRYLSPKAFHRTIADNRRPFRRFEFQPVEALRLPLPKYAESKPRALSNTYGSISPLRLR
jgi:hypothetical protein